MYNSNDQSCFQTWNFVVALLQHSTKNTLCSNIFLFCNYQETSHPLCLHLRDLNMWCFSCQAEVQPSDSSSGAGIDDVASPLRPKVTRTFYHIVLLYDYTLSMKAFWFEPFCQKIHAFFYLILSLAFETSFSLRIFCDLLWCGY